MYHEKNVKLFQRMSMYSCSKFIKLLCYRTVNALRIQRACKLAELFATFFSDLINKYQCIQRVISLYLKSNVKISTNDVNLSLFLKKLLITKKNI